MDKKSDGQKQATVRIGNRRLVLDLLRASEEMTVAQISDTIRLSKTTIWKIIDHFLDSGYVTLCGKGEASEEGGKKPELYRFNENCGYIISIALWGASIHLALVDARANVFYKEIVHIQNNEPLEIVIRYMADFIAKWQKPESIVRKNSRLFGIVVAASGVVDWESGRSITASRFNSWRVLSPIRDMIEELVTLEAPFYIDNYNRFHAYAEKSLGQVKEKMNIISIQINQDGVGAGIIADGNLKRGPRYLTGEVGHMKLNPYEKEICHCGGKGCFEQMVSTERLLVRAAEMLPSHPESRLNEGDVSLQGIFRASEEGDALACMLLDPIIGWTTMAIYNINLVFNAETIIIGGDYRTAGSYFMENLQKGLEVQGFTRMEKNFDIRYSIFDEEGALRGGACFALNAYFASIMDY